MANFNFIFLNVLCDSINYVHFKKISSKTSLNLTHGLPKILRLFFFKSSEKIIGFVTPE